MDVRHEIRATAPDISRAFDTVWHPTFLSKLSTYGTKGQLHIWLVDLLNSRSQHVALNGILSSPLPVKAGVPQCIVLDPSYSHSSSTISLTLWNIAHPSDRQAATSSLSADLVRIMS